MSDLNERQRAYLTALYDCDQSEENARRARAARGDWFDRTPASEWRWMMYGPVLPPSMLYMKLSHAKLIDPGTGSTWQALEDRGLVQCRYIPDALNITTLLQVKITPAGRKLIRAARGEQRPKALPKGQLKERQWAALVRLYAAGEQGIDNDTLLYAKGGFDWWHTIRRLVDYTPHLVEPFTVFSPYYSTFYRITSDGRAYYEREHERYHALYPNVALAQPNEETP